MPRRRSAAFFLPEQGWAEIVSSRMTMRLTLWASSSRQQQERGTLFDVRARGRGWISSSATTEETVCGRMMTRTVTSRDTATADRGRSTRSGARPSKSRSSTRCSWWTLDIVWSASCRSRTWRIELIRAPKSASSWPTSRSHPTRTRKRWPWPARHPQRARGRSSRAAARPGHVRRRDRRGRGGDHRGPVSSSAACRPTSSSRPAGASAVRSRLPWLYVNLLTAFMAGGVVYFFQGTVRRAVALAVVDADHRGEWEAMPGPRPWRLPCAAWRLALIPAGAVRSGSGQGILVGLINGLANGGGVVDGGVDRRPARRRGPARPGGVLGDDGQPPGRRIRRRLHSGVLLERRGVDPAGVASSIFVTTFTDVCGFLLLLGLAGGVGAVSEAPYPMRARIVVFVQLSSHSCCRVPARPARRFILFGGPLRRDEGGASERRADRLTRTRSPSWAPHSSSWRRFSEPGRTFCRSPTSARSENSPIRYRRSRPASPSR